MGQKFKILGSLVAFLILAGISCWATEKSLHLLLPAGWPEVLVWGITIAFFVMASYGSKLIVDTLSSPDFIDNRNLKLFGGVLLLFFFWFIMSMPTNTHTFFYNDKIGSVITKDIETTNKYLLQLIDKCTGSTMILDSVGKRMKDKVEEQRKLIVAEFNGDGPTSKRGNGVKIGEHLNIINGILNSSIQQDSHYNSTDPQILSKYHAQINVALASALRTHTISDKTVKNSKVAKTKLEAMNDSIQDHLSVGIVSEEEIKQVEKLLTDGYNIIATNKQFVDFDSKTDDKEVYTKENGDTRTKRMASVIDVFFVDFLHGKDPASFWYYVILSILVDVAAFIFFDIAFKKQDNVY